MAVPVAPPALAVLLPGSVWVQDRVLSVEVNAPSLALRVRTRSRVGWMMVTLWTDQVAVS